jgi:hypothetical protein
MSMKPLMQRLILSLGIVALVTGTAAAAPAAKRAAVIIGGGANGVTSEPAQLTGSAVVNFAQMARLEALGRIALPDVRYKTFDTDEMEQNETGIEPGANMVGPPAEPSPFNMSSLLPSVASPSPTQSFQGLDDIAMVDSSYIIIPPDVGGAVGLTKVMSAHNNNYRIFDKATGAVLSTVGTATFWSPVVAVAERASLTDPRTLYDRYNNRWIVCMQTTLASGGKLLIGVSQTSDPSGSWFLYSFNSGQTVDFPNLGFNKNWISMAINRYNAAGTTFARGINLLVNYPLALTGTGSGTIVTLAANTGFCSAPCVTYSATEDTLFVVTHLSSASGTYQIDRVTGTAAAPVYTASASGTLTRTGGGWVQPTGNQQPQSAPNAGASACGATPCALESQDSQIRSAPIYRPSATDNGYIYYAQTVNLPAVTFTHTAVQWTKLKTGGTFGAFVEGGRIEDATATSTNGGKWYDNASLAVNSLGDVLVGMSQFSSAQHPSAAYAYHDHTDAPNTMRDPFVYKAGEDYYHKTFSTATGRNRWGDFSSVVVDPSDDQAMWALQEYGKTRTGTDDGNTGSNSSKWSTYWAKVTPGPSFNIVASAGTGGSISPSGTLSVPQAGNQTFTITANSCFTIADVKVDGVSQGAITTFTFTNVQAAHTIAATFTQNGPYAIVASAGANGSITPNGTTNVTCGNSQAYTITPASCYSVASVVVDGVNQGAITTFTFTNVQAAHTISATFVQNGPYTISASAGANGTISPNGPSSVVCGTNNTYTITPNACYHVANVVVDGVNQGAITSFTFTNTQANHTISATFAINTYTSVASSSANGSISPVGTLTKNCGDNQTYTLTANSGYYLSSLVVDGSSVAPAPTYTFSNIGANHTIVATYSLDTATFAVGSSSTVLCPTNTSVTLPVTMSRSGGTAVLGYSVTLQLSGGLTLASGTGSITEGSFLSGSSATLFNVVDHGAGLYTVDCALTANCGPTATSGALFSLAVASSAPGGTGTVTVTSTKLRDCNNAVLTSAAGAAGTVAIDNQAPVVTVTSPNGGGAYLGGVTLPITWTATDNVAVANVDIAYSTDGGATYPNGIASGIANTGTFNWTVPSISSALVRVRVTAHDSGCSSAADASDANFSVGGAIVTAVGSTICLTPANTCVTVPVNIARSDATGLRLFHVDFTLSSNLKLCGNTGTSILEGAYLSAVNPNTTFFVVDNGGGSYTVDGTINGTPCGATAATGNLFNIQVAANGGTGDGTVTVNSVTLRDCVNNDIAPASAGAPAVIHIDTAPVAVASIATPQTIQELSTLTITPSATLTACATGPVTWSVIPALPSGATFSSSTGVITWTPACGSAGSYGPFTLTATAASGDAASSNAFSITVTHKPGTVLVAAIGNPQTVEETNTLTVTPSATLTTCAAGPTTWSVFPALPSGATFSSSTGVITWTPGCGEMGSYGPFTLTATAASGETGSSNTFSITVTHHAGVVTVASVSTPQSVEELSTLTITNSATFTACAAGPLTWSVSPALPSGASINSSTGEITWTPACGTAGSYGPFTVSATAATGEVGSSNAFAIVVTHKVGTVTVAAISTPQNADETQLFTLTPSATTTSCAGTLTWSVFPALPSGASLNASTGEITWTPACGTAGAYGPFTLTATASTGEAGSSDPFSILVAHHVGTVTVAAISSPQSVEETLTLTVTPSATLTACATGPLTWSVNPTLPSGATFNSATGVITWTPPCGSANGYGPFVLTATAASGESGSTQAFVIEATHHAGTVTVAAISTPQNVIEQSLLTITPSATLSACATGPMYWEVNPDLPSGATFNNTTGEITWTPACGEAGSYGPFTLTATAATGETGSSNAFSIVVAHKVGTVTVAAISTPQTVGEMSLLTILPSASFTSCAAGPTTWSVFPALPAGASFNSSTGEITWTPACGEAGNYGPFTLTATAATGEAGSSNAFAIVVTHTPGTVTVAAISSPQSVQELSTLTITPSATLAGCAAGPTTWSISPALPSGATFNSSTGVITWTPACGTVGSYGPFTLTATAATSEVGTSNAFTINVTHKPGTVTVAAVATPQNVIEQSPITITPSVTLTDCAAAPVVWSISPALPSGATFSSSTGVITWTPACGDAGTYGPFTLSATASTGEIGSSNTFSIVVAHKVGTVAVGAIATPQNIAELSTLTITPSFTLTSCATGPMTWSVSPALPSGASLDASTGVITWTPSCSAAEAAPGGNYGPFTLTATAATGEAGSSNAFTIHVTDTPVAIAAATGLTAVQRTTGNPAGQTTGVILNWTASAGATGYAVYRAPFDQYPEYDDNGGAVPTAPAAYPPAGPWVLTSVTSSGGVDLPPTRDYWYYVVYAQNSCGDWSVASNMTTGTLDYHLGDVTNGFALGVGDNLVQTEDISLLGAHYGITLAANDPFNYLDVGPTTTHFVDGRPLTDNKVNFEDLVLFAINYAHVSAPNASAKPAGPATAAIAADQLILESPDRVVKGDMATIPLHMQGTGAIQALSVQLSWDPAVVRPVGHRVGAMLLQLDGTVMSAKSGSVDAAVFGKGRGVTGDGELATVEFEAIANGDPKIRIEAVDARDTKNQAVTLNSTRTAIAPPLPTVTELESAMPNPFRSSVSLAIRMAKTGAVQLDIYSVDGRLVRSLAKGNYEPGTYNFTWDGRGEHGESMAAGIFYARMVTGNAHFVRKLTYLK